MTKKATAQRKKPAKLSWDDTKLTPWEALWQYFQVLTHLRVYGTEHDAELADLDEPTREKFEQLVEYGLLFEYVERSKQDLVRAGLEVPDDWLCVLCGDRLPLDETDRQTVGVVSRQVWAEMYRHDPKETAAKAPSPSNTTIKKRPAYKRDHLWLEWAKEIGLDTPNVEGQVRDKWNESSDDVRARCKPHHGKIPKGKAGYDRVRKGIGTALKERKEETET